MRKNWLYVGLVISVFMFGLVSCSSTENQTKDAGVTEDRLKEVGEVAGDDGTVDGETDKDVIADEGSSVDVLNDAEEAEVVDPQNWDWNLPDANVVYVHTAQKHSQTDEPYLIDQRVFYNTNVGACYCMMLMDKKIYAGTDHGVYEIDPQTKKIKRIVESQSPVVAISADPWGDGGCTVINRDIKCSSEHEILMDQDVTDIKKGEDCLWIGTKNGLRKWSGGQQIDQVGGVDMEVTGVFVSGQKGVLFTTEDGLYRVDNLVAKKINVDVLKGKKALSIGGDDNRIAVGTDKGLAVWDLKADKWTFYPGGIGGLAGDNIHGVCVRKNLVLMAYGYGGGAMVGNMNHLDYYVSHRWIPDDHVNDVVIDDEGNRWYCTQGGIGEIALKQQTLKDKARAMEEDMNKNYWRMDGFISPEATLKDDGTFKLWDSDNDGLWTQMMIGGLCYAYAVTGNKVYKDWAHKAMQTMYLLVDVPGETFAAKGMKRGFVARSLCREDEPCYASKKGVENWYFQEYKGVKYYWKDDTSSDEITGHLFGYPLYYDLCADESEKEEVRKHYLEMVDYIVDNGFRLINLEGKETKWGHWQPERIAIAVDGYQKCIKSGHKAMDCLSSAYGGGWLNSLEILALLLSAYHVSGGKAKYFNAFKELILKYKYWKLAMGNKNTMTVTNPMVANHSDHELAILSYHTLIRYEPDPKRRQWWIKSLKWFYEHERPERNPLWTAITAMFIPDYPDIDAALQSLREFPLDRREIRVNNMHRKDGKIIGLDRHNEKQFDRVFPYDEIRTIWWNGNLYDADEGGNDRVYRGPMAYLLAYWAARYSGILFK